MYSYGSKNNNGLTVNGGTNTITANGVAVDIWTGTTQCSGAAQTISSVLTTQTYGSIVANQYITSLPAVPGNSVTQRYDNLMHYAIPLSRRTQLPHVITSAALLDFVVLLSDSSQGLAAQRPSTTVGW